jgi:hypothetical protein
MNLFISSKIWKRLFVFFTFEFEFQVLEKEGKHLRGKDFFKEKGGGYEKDQERLGKKMGEKMLR